MKAHELGVAIHKFSLKLPKFELYETGSQIRRASKSVPANIIEGYGRRRYKADCVNLLAYNQSSCDEANEWLVYIQDLYEELAPEAKELLGEVDGLGRQINMFIQSVGARK